jgi:hypothetical protein
MRLHIKYLHIWGCPAKAKMFNPQTENLNPRTIRCLFIGYIDKSKGCQFYCPDRTTKFVETSPMIFLVCDGGSEARKIALSKF